MNSLLILKDCYVYNVWNYVNIFTYIFYLKWYIVFIPKPNYLYPIVRTVVLDYSFFNQVAEKRLRNNLLMQRETEDPICFMLKTHLTRFCWHYGKEEKKRENRNYILNNHKANSMMWSSLLDEEEYYIVNTKMVILQYYLALLYLLDAFLKIISKVNLYILFWIK